MRTIDATRGSAVSISPERTITEAAQLMEQTGVGALVVLDGESVVGIVTDRDLVRRAMARSLPGDARVDGVMTSPVITAEADGDLRRAVALFKQHAIRRLPLVRDGAFVGMFTVDDALVGVTQELDAIARPVTAEMLFAHRDPVVPATTG
jgi:CBS domain-containing protein